VRELLDNLSKWEIPSLTKRFMERLDHLKGNSITKDELHKKILHMQKIFEDKQSDATVRIRAAYIHYN
jgi:hypothetical protein